MVRALIALLLAGPAACAGWDRDRDRDGHLAPLDCDDDDAAVHPAADEACGNGVDDDCDGRAVGCGVAGWTAVADADALVVGNHAEGWDIEGATGAGDVDGDGLADVLVRARSRDEDRDRVWLLRGPIEGRSALEERAPLWESFTAGGPIAGGDLDGDGLSELVIGTVPGWDGNGRLLLFEGAVGALGGAARAEVWFRSSFGDGQVALAGDADGDGTADLAVVDRYTSIAPAVYGAAWILPGTVEGLVDPDDVGVRIEGTAEASPSGPVAAADVDGDGLGDLVIEAGGQARVFLGPVAPGTTADADATVCCARALAAGDVDGDGLADLLLGSSGDGTGESVSGELVGAAFLFLAPLQGDRASEAAIATIHGAPGTWYSAETVAVPGDLDGDGRAEVALSGDTGWANAAFVFRGGVTGTRTTTDADVVLYGDEYDETGRGVTGAGDTDGDGFSDLLVRSPYYDDGGEDRAGAVALFRGGLGF